MLEKMRDEDFDAVYEMLTQSFPSHELRDYNHQKALLADPKFCVYVIRDTTSRHIKAFISVWDIDDFGFIDHFAVSPHFRNEGLGSKILQAIRTTLNRGIFLEVEPPETETAKRRIAFYQRNGYTLNPYKYELPPLAKGRTPTTLMIMSSDGELAEQRFMLLKKSLFRIAYGTTV